MKLGNPIILWTISILLMIFIVIYQKVTGPTYPLKGSTEILGTEVDYALPRSNDGDFTVRVEVNIPEKSISGKVKMKRFKSHDEWSEFSLNRSGDNLYFEIPNQPAAGKVMYHIYLSNSENEYWTLTDKPVILRFRDNVPAIIIILHVLFIFLTIALSTRAGLEALISGDRVKLYTVLSLLALVIGGFIFGPLMQKYAFGEYWTGWPTKGFFALGDLTDSKTFVALFFWLIALWRIITNPNDKKWAIIAAVVLLIVYLVPHSMLGSELDYTQMNN